MELGRAQHVTDGFGEGSVFSYASEWDAGRNQEPPGCLLSRGDFQGLCFQSPCGHQGLGDVLQISCEVG